MTKNLLLLLLGVVTAGYVVGWTILARRPGHAAPGTTGKPRLLDLIIGFGANFLDTLGIGSFATTSSAYKLRHLVQDEDIPGTLNVGHAIPTIVEAFIFVAILEVDMKTLVALIVASVLGAWLGAGVISSWSRRKVQIGLGLALCGAAVLMMMTQLKLLPGGGTAIGLEGIRFWLGVAGNFMLGALMTLGIGLYAPCMILIYLLGMTPTAAFPIMMGSCAFLMPIGGLRFIRSGRYNMKAAVGLALGGIPGVLLAAFLVKSLPLSAVRWLVVCVVLYTAAMLLKSAVAEAKKARDNPLEPSAETSTAD